MAHLAKEFTEACIQTTNARSRLEQIEEGLSEEMLEEMRVAAVAADGGDGSQY